MSHKQAPRQVNYTCIRIMIVTVPNSLEVDDVNFVVMLQEIPSVTLSFKVSHNIQV